MDREFTSSKSSVRRRRGIVAGLAGLAMAGGMTVLAPIASAAPTPPASVDEATQDAQPTFDNIRLALDKFGEQNPSLAGAADLFSGLLPK